MIFLIILTLLNLVAVFCEDLFISIVIIEVNASDVPSFLVLVPAKNLALLSPFCFGVSNVFTCNRPLDELGYYFPNVLHFT